MKIIQIIGVAKHNEVNGYDSNLLIGLGDDGLPYVWNEGYKAEDSEKVWEWIPVNQYF